ncbi:reverse transcriptase [Phytophthora megakarya]|uniref:Reverse transcriptase n=1 Tax=Phytophthora megakarya TaxID=4795 RepID=A0A225WX04_9STRA|nr:reverse transcriptase [Phytophthora megakarya]
MAFWFMNLDMASGFWAIRMTERAKLILASVCPFTPFQWITIPRGGRSISRSLDYLNLDPPDDGPLEWDIPRRPGCDNDYTRRFLPTLADQMTVVKRYIPA